jgi:hypothetical protein
MKRENEMRVYDFCADQHGRFEARAWTESTLLPREHLAVVAFFLAATEWYGHGEELLSVAEALQPGITQDFLPLARKYDFDFARFTAMLKEEVFRAAARA